MADLLQMSQDIIDNGVEHGPINRINHELSELGDGIAIVEAFSHSVTFDTDEGLVVFDTSGAQGGQAVVDGIRRWSDKPFHMLVFTHGHIDHVGGSGAFIEDTKKRKHAQPMVVGHENVLARFTRYDLTNDYNNLINTRQFFSFTRRGYTIGGSGNRFLPDTVAHPDVTYKDNLSLKSGDMQFDLYHAKGETDDHTWTWIPKYKAICAGDFFIWNFPNAGNPQKVQRYPWEWAQALRAMAAKNAELFIPAHGLPIAGTARINRVLNAVAEVLETLVKQTLAMMNQGARLNEIVHSVKVSPELLARPWLRPLYDEPEFLVHNIWRLYGGWYDGNPANLKPAPEVALATELIKTSGGIDVFVKRALELCAQKEDRLACHLIEFAVSTEPENLEVHAARAHIYQQRRSRESSLMAKGIFTYTANLSLEKTDPKDT